MVVVGDGVGIKCMCFIYDSIVLGVESRSWNLYTF